MGNWKKDFNFVNPGITEASSYQFCKIAGSGSASFPLQSMTQWHRSSEIHGCTKHPLHPRTPPSPEPPGKRLQKVIWGKNDQYCYCMAQTEAALESSLRYHLSEGGGV